MLLLFCSVYILVLFRVCSCFVIGRWSRDGCVIRTVYHQREHHGTIFQSTFNHKPSIPIIFCPPATPFVLALRIQQRPNAIKGNHRLKIFNLFLPSQALPLLWLGLAWLFLFFFFFSFGSFLFCFFFFSCLSVFNCTVATQNSETKNALKFQKMAYILAYVVFLLYLCVIL